MAKNKFLFVVLATVFLPIILQAQTVTKGREFKKATVDFTEQANYYEAHPQPQTRKPLFNEEEEERPERGPVEKSLVHLLDRTKEKASYTPHTSYLPVSPAPIDTFESTVSDHTGIPPDTHGAVDSAFCVTAINTAVHIQSRAGFNFSGISLDGFWNPLLSHGPGSFDPRVHYDPNYKRWILVTDAYGQTGYSMIFIAVSVTNNPLGAWHMYSIAVDPTGLAWMDFPNVGYNNKWITVTGNMFPNSGGGASGAVIYVFDYASIMAGTGAPFVKFSQPSSFAIAPALTYDATEPNMFMLENWDNTTGKLRLWKLTGPVASPTLSTIGYPQTTTHWRSGPSSGGNFLPQVGSTNTMEPGDDRITSVTYRNHKLWCSHTIFLPSSGTTTHSSIMWWQVDTLANPLQVGLVNDPTAATSYAYSSIAVNAENDALVGFGYFSHTVHASCGYALHMNTDPVDSIRPAVVYRHGQAYYYETFGGTRNRWGDYSATCVDPRNDTDFWTLQETTVIGTSPNWDTWWAKVQFCPKPNQPTMSYSSPIPCVGASATYAINPVAGATSYVWSVGGTGWSGSSTSDTIHVTAGTGMGTITVLAYNSCGEGEAHVFTVTPHVAPNAPYVSVYSPACIGSPTAIFSASASGATGFSWVALDSGWSGTSTGTSLTANVGTGTGMIICTATNACGSSHPDTIYATPAVVPTSSFTVANHVVLAYTNDTLTYTGSAPAGSTYTWNFGGGTGTPGTGAGPQIVQWTVPGLKTVTLYLTNSGCSSALYSDTVLVLFNPSVKVGGPVQKNQELSIVPNPNNGTFDLLFANAVNKQIIVKLVDMQGKVVYNESFIGTNNKKVTIATHDLPNGTYMANVNLGGEIATQMVSINK